MRNHFFLLTVLAVTIWTSGGDQVTRQTEDGGGRQNDFYLEDMEEGSGDLYSSYSSYTSNISSDDEDSEPPESSGYIPSVGISGSMHLNRVYFDAYDNSSSLRYLELETDFKLAMDDLMKKSPLKTNYISTTVIGFSHGSVKVEFVVEMESVDRLEEALGAIIEAGVNGGDFAGLNPNASSIVIKPQESDPEMMFTTPTSQDKKTPPMETDDGDKYRPKDKPDDEVDVEEKNILDMILNDPIIIAAIVGGLIVILLSIILLFLFVVYRLKKKDEGSYSLDEPAKAKDPTAYWKETKEFYA